MNPCSSDAGCEHFCFMGADQLQTCVCFANYELNDDGKTCRGNDSYETLPKESKDAEGEREYGIGRDW